MKDYFALLDQPRRPWLDKDTVQQAFVSAVAEYHPDRIHDAPPSVRREAHDRYTALNEAHLCLRNARCRLRHLLQLERGCSIKDLQQIPDDLMQLFTRLSQQLRETDKHLATCAETTSALLKVRLFEQGAELLDQLQQTQRILQTRDQHMEDRLRSLSDQWERLSADDPDLRERVLAEMETLYRVMSFNHRWRDQVQSRLMQLMAQA